MEAGIAIALNIVTTNQQTLTNPMKPLLFNSVDCYCWLTGRCWKEQRYPQL